jgi:hypothetical protein
MLGSVTEGPRDEPGDQVDPTSATGGLGPPFHAAVQRGTHVGGVGQGAAHYQSSEGGLDVKATGTGFSEGRQQRTPCRAGSHRSEISGAQPRTGEQGVPTWL